MQDNIAEKKKEIIEHFDQIAEERESWIRKNIYYYRDLKKFFTDNIFEGSSVIEIGCGDGNLLNSLAPKRGVGIDISPKMVEVAKRKFPHLEFYQMDAEDIRLNEKFDYIIISDSLGYFVDIQKVFNELKKIIKPESRIIITAHNFFWTPFLRLAEMVGRKMPQKRLNWLNRYDVANLLFLEDFDVIKAGMRFLFPFRIPFVSEFINRYVANLPLVNLFCLTEYIIARPNMEKHDNNRPSISVIIPARNEKGNIENAIKRTPLMGSHTEFIFVEGHSSDGTLDEIKRVAEQYQVQYDIKYAVQEGKGKGDAVRRGFAMATGDILMILDADLTTPPEDMPKFYRAIADNKGEFINGTRLVYPLEDDSMRALNILGNKFFSIMFTWLLGQRLKDTLCGTKVISKKNYEKLIINRKYFGDFDPFGDFDLIFGAAKLNLKIVEIPIRYQARIYGSTNISRFRHGWVLLKMVFFAMNKIKFR